MNTAQFEDEVGNEVYRAALHEHNRVTGNNSLGGVLHGFDCALDFIGDGMDWSYSAKGYDYWQEVHNSLYCIHEPDIQPTYTRQPTRKRIAKPLWVRCSNE